MGLGIILNSRMIFASCVEEQISVEDKLDRVESEPLKFKLLKGISLLDIILRNMAEPNKKEKYLFPRNNLHYLRD